MVQQTVVANYSSSLELSPVEPSECRGVVQPTVIRSCRVNIHDLFRVGANSVCSSHQDF